MPSTSSCAPSWLVGDPTPSLTPEGQAGLAVAVGTALLAVIHAVHYGVWARREG
ncbi:MAG: hypothetical protein ACRDPQ_03220 [Nocardioidaceae bacterium]